MNVYVIIPMSTIKNNSTIRVVYTFINTLHPFTARFIITESFSKQPPLQGLLVRRHIWSAGVCCPKTQEPVSVLGLPLTLMPEIWFVINTRP